MVDRVDLATAVDAELVDDARQMLEVLAHPETGVAGAAEPEGAADVVAPAAAHGRIEFVVVAELLHVKVGELGLGIERVDVAGAAFHEEIDARLGFGRVLLGARSEWGVLSG